MSDPLVSVVTPSYNQAEFIEDTLNSVRNQRYDRVEHVVVDGESDDGTLDILRKYDDEITWVSEPDKGQSDAINKGFDMASGEIIGWLNSDDVYFDTSSLARVVKYFDRYDADVIYGDIALLDADSNVLKIHSVPDFDMQRLLRYCFIEQPALFFKSEVIQNNKLNQGLEYVMDYEFWLRLAHDYQFQHVVDVLAGDRNHAQRKILHDRKQMLTETIELQESYGVSHSMRYRFDRTADKIFSGLPRRLKVLKTTLRMQVRDPEFAFDGELRPTSEMLRNVFVPNHDLV